MHGGGRGMHGWVYAWQRACLVGGVCVVVEACVSGDTATAADGTHPTGMHSCINCICKWQRPQVYPTE